MAKLEDELGDIIAKARIGQGRTQAQLANMAGCSVGDIESIENYRLRPDESVLDRIAQALSLNADKLALLAQQQWEPSSPALQRENMLLQSVEIHTQGYIENGYIIGCRETGEAAVVDPGGSADQISRSLSENGLTLNLVLITHAHRDHIGGLRELISSWPKAGLVNHQLERDSVTSGIRVNWLPAKDGVSMKLGNLNIQPLFTPGHTPGSTCYGVDGLCFVGDTLFAGSIGRPAGQSVYSRMLSDIKGKVLSLPADTLLLPGHGPITTVGQEIEHNPFF